MEKIKPIHPSIRSHVRYQLAQKMMEHFLVSWFNQTSTSQLIDSLIQNFKEPKITISAPSPIFTNKLTNSLNSCQIAGNHFIPPLSPNAASLQKYHNEKKNSLTESSQTNNDDKKKLNDSLSNSMQTSMKLSKIPKFYFPDNSIASELLEEENDFINSVFNQKNELKLEEFLPFTKDFYHFPPLYNRVLFEKIDSEKKGKITKAEFISFHNANFRGVSNVKKFFNFIKSPKKKDIYPDDFRPFLRCLLDFNQSLDFLKDHPLYQKKYSDTVIYRIYYINDTNDDGKITLREFKKSNLIDVLSRVSENDINAVRDYFSYEHFYVIYCIFYEIDKVPGVEKDPEQETLIGKEIFSKYDGHALGEKVVDRIFQQVPRKFKSGKKDIMCYEDFLWYLLSEEDKTSQTSIKYWFKVLDLDGNGIVTPSEMQYFYQEQEKRLENLQNEVIHFNDVLCQVYDMIPPDKEYQWTLQNFLAHPESASIAFNALFNLKKFVENEQKDPFQRTEIDKMPDFTDWDKFAYTEYMRKINDEEEEGVDNEGAEFDSNEENNGEF